MSAIVQTQCQSRWAGRRRQSRRTMVEERRNLVLVAITP